MLLKFWRIQPGVTICYSVEHAPGDAGDAGGDEALASHAFDLLRCPEPTESEHSEQNHD